MNTPTAWGGVQDAAYHLERAITKEVSAMLLVGGDLVPQGRAVLKEAGDWVQMAHRDVEALVVTGKRRHAARMKVLKCLQEAEAKGAGAAALLFREKVSAKDIAAICTAVSDAVTEELDALNALLVLRS